MRLTPIDNFMQWFSIALVAFFLFGPTVDVVIHHWRLKHHKYRKVRQREAVGIDAENFLYVTGFLSLGIDGYIYIKYSFPWYAYLPLCFFVWFLLAAGIKLIEELLVYIVKKWL